MNRFNRRAKSPVAFQSQEKGEIRPDVLKTKQCPSCNQAVREQDDICENCQAWLLENQCCFCYKEISPGQKFCTGCGNQPKGIPCSGCGTVSHFDFCANCETPISKSGQTAVSKLRKDPELTELLSVAKQDVVTKQEVKVDNSHAILDQLQTYHKNNERAPTATHASAPPEPKKAGFNFGSENIDFSDALQQSNQAAEKQSRQEIKSEQVELLKKKVKKLQEKTFSNNQEARKYYTSLKILLPEFKPCSELLGWRCNYVSYIHYNGPSGCACPNLGGEWVCKDDIEWIDATSFIYNGLTYTHGDEPLPSTD